MISIPTKEPSSLRAGDTWKWRREDLSSVYPASQWTLNYYFLKSDKQIVITATADGDYFVVNVPAVTTSTYPAGTYSWIAKVSNGIEEYTVDSGTIEILPNLASQSSGYDGRSHVKKVLDALQAAIEGRATRTELSYAVAGRQIQFMKPEELIKWYSHYKRLYEQEKQAERIKKGLSAGNKIYVRFVG